MAAESGDHGRRNGEDGMSEYKSILVDRVKRLQRSSHEIKQQWYNYCRRNGTSHYDPSRHDESYLQAFLKSFEGPLAPASSESHEPSPAKEMGGKSALIQRVKGIQRSSPENKKAWYAFCARQCTTNYDPARHDEIFLRKFVEGFEEAAAASLAADQAAAAAAAAEAFGSWAGQAPDSWWGGGCGGCKGGCEGCGGGGSSSSSSSGSWGGSGWDPSSWSGEGGGGGGSGDDQWWDESGEWDNWYPPPAAWMMMMKGKSMMMAKGAAMWGGKGMASCGDMADKGKGAMAAMMQQMAAGCGKSGSSGGGVPFVGPPPARLPPNTAPTGSSGGISEFGILDVPLTQERLNQKRGFGSCSVESTGSGAIMDEEQARKFQESLKKRKT